MEQKQVQKRVRIWSYYKGLYGWAVFNNITKTISHYEETEREAFRICMQWNMEKKEF